MAIPTIAAATSAAAAIVAPLVPSLLKAGRGIGKLIEKKRVRDLSYPKSARPRSAGKRFRARRMASWGGRASTARGTKRRRRSSAGGASAAMDTDSSLSDLAVAFSTPPSGPPRGPGAPKVGRSTARPTKGGAHVSHDGLTRGYHHDKSSACVAITNIPFLNCPVEVCLPRGTHVDPVAGTPIKAEKGPGDFWKTELGQVRNRADKMYVETISNNGKYYDPGIAKGVDLLQPPTYFPFPAELETKYSPVWLPDMSAIGIVDDPVTPPTNTANLPGGETVVDTLVDLRVQNQSIRAQRSLFQKWRCSLVTMKIRWNGSAPIGWYRVYEGFRDDLIRYQTLVNPVTGVAETTVMDPAAPYPNHISYQQSKKLAPIEQLKLDYGAPDWQYGLNSYTTAPSGVSNSLSDDNQTMHAEWNISPGAFPAQAAPWIYRAEDGHAMKAVKTGRKTFHKENFRRDRAWRRIPSGGVFELKIKLTNRFVNSNENLSTGPPPIVLFAYDGDDQWKPATMRTIGHTAEGSTAPTISGAASLQTISESASEQIDAVIGRMDVVYCIDFKERGVTNINLPTSSASFPISNTIPVDKQSLSAYVAMNPIAVIPFAARALMDEDPLLNTKLSLGTARSLLLSSDPTMWTDARTQLIYARKFITYREEFAFALADDLSEIIWYTDPDRDEAGHVAAPGFTVFKLKDAPFMKDAHHSGPAQSY